MSRLRMVLALLFLVLTALLFYFGSRIPGAALASRMRNMEPSEYLGYAAASAVFVTFCMNTMLWLRAVAVISNVLFMLYGALDTLYPVLILHSVLLPVNMLKLAQMYRLTQDIARARSSDLSIEKFLGFMKERVYPAGHVLFRKGDVADRLYYVADGELLISELGKTVGPGSLIGEIGIFSPENRRTAGVTCETACRIYELSEAGARQLYFQDPAFGFGLMRLVISRLLEQRTPVFPQQEMRPSFAEASAPQPLV